MSYRPPGWAAHDRPGAVEAAGGRPLVIEGCGVGRAELAGLADLVVWVQSDRTLARVRGLGRDASYGTRTPEEAEAFWDDWMTEEEPFLRRRPAAGSGPHLVVAWYATPTWSGSPTR